MFCSLKLAMLIAALITALPSQADVTLMRYDVQLGRKGAAIQWDHLTPVKVTASATEGTITNKLTASSFQQNQFVFVFNCTAQNPALCEKARQGYINAGARIAACLSITSQINVLASFGPLSPGLLGKAGAASFFVGRPSDAGNNEGWYSYPQALVKQTQHAFEPQYGEYDIIADFNSDIPFYFSNDQQAIGQQQMDFEAVVCHELIHGLGFSSYWKGYSLRKSMILPNIAVQGSSDTATANSVLTSWTPMKIYDRYMISTQTSISIMDYANSIFSMPIQSGTIFSNFVSQLEMSGYPYHSAATMYSLATTSQALGLRTSADLTSDVKLYTTSTFVQGQSISHLDGAIYRSTADFLMCHNNDGLLGKTLDTLIAQTTNNGQSSPMQVIGPKVLQVLSAMGWPTRMSPNPTLISFQMSNAGSPAAINPNGNPISNESPTQRLDAFFYVYLSCLLFIIS